MNTKTVTCRKNAKEHSGRDELSRTNKKTVAHNNIDEQKEAAALTPGILHTYLNVTVNREYFFNKSARHALLFLN